MKALQLEGVTLSFGGSSPAVNQVSLGIEPGTFFCLLGPSGCGKTTLLRMIGGYLTPSAGKIIVAGEDVTQKPPEARNIGMVFQSYALFPHLTARQNVAFGLEARGVPRAERERRTEEMLDRVGISKEERGRRPKELSGGQQQRVAVARALVIEPRLLLLDEPLANLDRRLRERLRVELREIQRRTGVTTILVTHDQEEAFSLADQVGLMLNGRFLQIASPEELYLHPKTPFVARFVGEANLLAVQGSHDDSLLADGLKLTRGSLQAKQGDTLLLRPESLLIGESASRSRDRFEGRVAAVNFTGADRMVEVEIGKAILKARCRTEELHSLKVGQTIPLGIAEGALWMIPEPDPKWVTEGLTTGALREAI